MANKQEIKNIAFSLFARKGFYETSTEDIASAVGLKKQSLYSHFNSKNEIISEILQDQSTFLITEIDKRIKALSTQPPEALFKGIFQGYIDIFSDRDRLLLWKRVVLISDCEEVQVIFNQNKWQYELANTLFGILQKIHPSINHAKFNSFYLSYMLLIQGYLDLVLISGHDASLCSIIWNNFWNGTASLFSD